MYLDRIAVLEARDRLSMIESISFPYQETDDQKEILQKYQKVVGSYISTSRNTGQKEVDINWEMLRRGIIPRG